MSQTRHPNLCEAPHSSKPVEARPAQLRLHISSKQCPLQELTATTERSHQSSALTRLRIPVQSVPCVTPIRFDSRSLQVWMNASAKYLTFTFTYESGHCNLVGSCYEVGKAPITYMSLISLLSQTSYNYHSSIITHTHTTTTTHTHNHTSPRLDQPLHPLPYRGKRHVLID